MRQLFNKKNDFQCTYKRFTAYWHSILFQVYQNKYKEVQICSVNGGTKSLSTNNWTLREHTCQWAFHPHIKVSLSKNSQQSLFFCFWNNSNCITSHFGPFLSVAYEFVFISLPAFEHWISMLKEFDEYFLKYFDKYFLRVFFSASIFDCT